MFWSCVLARYRCTGALTLFSPLFQKHVMTFLRGTHVWILWRSVIFHISKYHCCAACAQYSHSHIMFLMSYLSNISKFECQPIGVLQHTATHCSTLQHTAAHCNTCQHTATHWMSHFECQPIGVLQHITTHCSTLQHTATHCNVFRVSGKRSTLTHSKTLCTLKHTEPTATFCGRL